MDQRNRSDLQDVLRFTLERSSPSGTNTSVCQEMDEERRLFLENALKSMNTDINSEFQSAIKVLHNNSSTKLEKCNALRLIRNYIDNIDFANMFATSGGIKILVEYIKEEDIQLRILAINIVAEMSQNNPFCQKQFVDQKVLPILVTYFHSGEDVASSALYAVSSLVRGSEENLNELLNIGGIKLILSCLKTSSTRVFVKACFLISALSSEHPSIRDEFVKLRAFEMLSDAVEVVSDYDSKIEATLSAMTIMVESTYLKLVPELREDLGKVLVNIIDNTRNLPQCEEIVAYSNLVLNGLKG